MQIEDVKILLNPFIESTVIKFQIDREIFDDGSGRKIFNNMVRQYVDEKFGIYVWANKTTEEIVYVGMAGTIKTDARLGEHTLRGRLLASRGKNKLTNKDIQTNDYILELMIKNSINSFDLYIMYSKEGEPPAYIEALLLYKYYKENNRLPRFNNAF